MVKLLIIFMIANVIQNFLYSRQVKEVNNFFCELKTRGNVLVGKKRGIINKGVILMLLLGDDLIKEAYVLEGMTIFSKIKSYKYIENKKLNEDIRIEDNRIREAFKNAIENYTKETNQ